MGEFAVSRALYRGGLFLVCFVALLLIVRELVGVVMQVFTACVIAAAISPMVDRMTRAPLSRHWKWRLPRAIGVLIIYLVLGVVFFVLGVFVLGGIVSDIGDLIQALPTYAASIRAWVADVATRLPALQNVDLARWVTEGMATVVGWALSFAQGLLGVVAAMLGLLGSLLSIVFILMMALYLTVDAERMRNYLLVFLPPSTQPRVRRVSSQVVTRLGQWVKGQLLLCLIVGGGAWLGLQIIGVPYAVLLGVLWAICEFIPGVGPFISAFPTILLGFTVSPTTGLLAALFTLVWSQVESNVITPKVLGSAAEIHPLVVLVSILVGAELLGFAGALLAIPFAAVVGVLVDEIHAERLRDQLQVDEPDTVAEADGSPALVAPVVGSS